MNIVTREGPAFDKPELFADVDIPTIGNGGESYDIISKVAYLIGVPKKIFDNEHEPPKIEVNLANFFAICSL